MNSWFTIIVIALAGLLSISYHFTRKNRKRNGYELPPGPRGLPLIGHLHLLGELPHQSLYKLAQKFGPMINIRLGLIPTIVVSSPETAQLVLKTHDVVFASRPKVEAAEYMCYEQNDVAFAEYGPHWRKLRKVCIMQLLNSSKIESMKSMREEDVRGFVMQLIDEAKTCNVVNVTVKLRSLMEDMTFRMVIGRNNDAGTDLRCVVAEMSALTGAFNLADYFPFVRTLDLQGLRHRMKKIGKVVDKVLEKIIDEHARNANTGKHHHRDFIDEMLCYMEKTSVENEKIDRATVKAIILDMINGAIDTSSTTIEWALSELIKNQRVMKQLQSELEKVVGMDRMVEESDLINIDYLDFVIKETMRLHPPGPLLIPHESMEDITINGFYIPKKSRIIVNAWAIGRDPQIWSTNVNEFYPERFIGTKMNFNGQDLRFIPFGSGRRRCLGMQVGVINVQLILAQLVHCFNWDLPDGMSPDDLNMNEKLGLMLVRAIPLLAKPTFRLHIDIL